MLVKMLEEGHMYSVLVQVQTYTVIVEISTLAPQEAMN